LQQQFPDDLPPKLDEHTPLDFNNAPDFLSCVGRAWEKATRPLSESGVRVVNLRFGVVLAKKGGALPRIALPFYLFIGGKVGTGQQPFSWIQLDDVIRAFDFLMQNRELSGPINLVAPQCVTQQELAKAIGKVLHRPSVVPMPSIILKLFFGSMAQELLLEGQNVYPQRLLAAGFDFKCPDIESALKHIYVCHKHSE
jgi:uncharacterized protein (TIGR01777 family)